MFVAICNAIRSMGTLFSSLPREILLLVSIVTYISPHKYKSFYFQQMYKALSPRLCYPRDRLKSAGSTIVRLEESHPESKRAFLGRTRIELGFSVARQKCIARIMSNENVWEMDQHCIFLLYENMTIFYTYTYTFLLEREKLPRKFIRSEVNFKFHEKFNEFPIFEIGLHAAASNDIYSSKSIERSNSL